MRAHYSACGTRLARQRIFVAVSTLAFTLLVTASAQATTPGINDSFTVPGDVPAAFACYGSRCAEVEGVKDVKISITASGAVVDPASFGTTGANCQRVDKTFKATVGAGGSGVITISYTEVDPYTGEETPGKLASVKFSGGVNGPTTETISLCVR